MRRVDLADYLGLTSETVSRSLTKKGIIKMHGPRGIEIFEYCVL
ncbi:helix-turn-helix domain-containing protein [Sinorhizobium medicae]|nr:helix-turn-helix domain-containing protein [Sinorhizobium medicae]MDX0408308.1 helix-turn-helix domain-containing protein [Sinorhizobium medicae]MDX0414503.1 helix-turn-helix domain-containing protein [Sinorhizobium medicae]MDX0420254.1 helix-turn-helix domain-containing protein [Sinorhizobium medicae]MDX0475616.1 helix-turn-helix domain-containing protein [Sinorhizobium medicae]MDX0494476.1 helix-turn-helix domain-containing protein [Sinorhizobium medicae]